MVEFGCAVLSALLKLTKSLGLLFLFFFLALVFSDFGLFSLSPLTLVLHNLGVKLLFSQGCLFLLLLLVLVGDFDFLVHYSDTFALLSCQLVLILLELFDVCHRDFLLTLSHLLVLVTLLLTRCDLVDENLCTTLASNSSSFLSLEFLLDSLKTFDFHHRVKSLLFSQPVLFEIQILFLLLVTNCVDLGSEDHLIHVLHIVVLLVHLVHGLLQELVLVIVLHLDFKRCRGGPLSVLCLHAGLAGQSHGHLGGSLLIGNHALLPNRGHVLNDHIVADSV